MISDQLIIDVAGALLFIDASLTSKVSSEIQEAVAGNEDDKDVIAAEVAFDESRKLIIKESRVSLHQAKDAIIEFITNGFDHKLLEHVPERITEARGAAGILDLDGPRELLEQTADYISEKDYL